MELVKIFVFFQFELACDPVLLPFKAKVHSVQVTVRFQTLILRTRSASFYREGLAIACLISQFMFGCSSAVGEESVFSDTSKF